MIKATTFCIENHSEGDVVLFPKDDRFAKDFSVFIKSKHFVIKDLRINGMIFSLDLDECYFQFVGKKRKHTLKGIKKYGIELEVIE